MPEPAASELRRFYQEGANVRKTDAVILEHVIALADQVTTLARSIAAVKEEIRHNAEIAADRSDAILRAFPADDPAGHRAYHDELIAAENARKKFWQKLFFELAKWGLLGFAGWLIVAGWSAFLKGPK